MNFVISPYLSSIRNLIWYQDALFSFPNEKIANWLKNSASLTSRLKGMCTDFRVVLLRSDWIGTEQLMAHEQTLLPREEKYLCRQVILRGDGEDWVLGHSVIPQSTVYGQSIDFTQLGEEPMGDKLFSSNYIYRDALTFSVFSLDSRNDHYARCSRLWIDQKPMVVTEIFLPQAPIYREENPA